MKYAYTFIVALFMISCSESGKRIDIENSSWSAEDSIQTVGRAYPILLSFKEGVCTLQSPGLQSTFELASYVHSHGTSIAGKPPVFSWSYDIGIDSIVKLRSGPFSDDIKLTFKNGKLLWPLWRSNSFATFVTESK